MSTVESAPDFEAYAQRADGTESAPMEVTDVRASRRFDGWVITATKCRREFIELLEADGFDVGTIYPEARTLTIHVRREDE